MNIPNIAYLLLQTQHNVLGYSEHTHHKLLWLLYMGNLYGLVLYCMRQPVRYYMTYI